MTLFRFRQLNLLSTFAGIDSTASFFGDPTLKRRGIREVVADVFAKGELEIDHEGTSITSSILVHIDHSAVARHHDTYSLPLPFSAM